MPRTTITKTTGRKVAVTTTKKRGRPATKAIRQAKAAHMRSFIKKVVDSRNEKKIAVYQTGFPFGGGSLGSNIFPLTPYTGYMTIAQGTGQGDRIGDKVRVKSAIMRYTIYPNAYNATSNPTPVPQNIRIWFFSVKNSNTLLTTNPLNFIQTGNSSTTLSGTILDLNRVMNKDLYTYHGHRTHKVGIADFVATPGSTPSYGYYSNNDYKFNIQGFINLTDMFPAVIKWNDTGTVPSSNLVQFLIECVNADGSSQTSLITPCTMNYQVTMTYTDD